MYKNSTKIINTQICTKIIYTQLKLSQKKFRNKKNRKFEPNPNKAVRIKEAKNPNIQHVTLSLPYTSFCCSSIASKIHKIVKKYTPNFKLRIAFSTLKLSRIILPTLNPKKDKVQL